MKTEHAIDWRKSAEEISNDYEAKCKLIESQAAEIDRLQHDYHSACKLVADMHYAAVGEIMGAKVGVVEDVAAMKAERDKYKALCDQLGRALESVRYRSLKDKPVDPALEAWRVMKCS